jgi:hypothetical protein
MRQATSTEIFDDESLTDEDIVRMSYSKLSPEEIKELHDPASYISVEEWQQLIAQRQPPTGTES